MHRWLPSKRIGLLVVASDLGTPATLRCPPADEDEPEATLGSRENLRLVHVLLEKCWLSSFIVSRYFCLQSSWSILMISNMKREAEGFDQIDDLYSGKLCLRPCGTECREFDRDCLELIRS